MRSLYVLIVFVTVLTLTKASPSLECKNQNPMQNFNLSGLVGFWYQAVNNHILFEEGCDCFYQELVAHDTNSIDIYNCCQKSKVSNTTQNCEIGVNKLTLVDPDKKEGLLEYTRFGTNAISLLWIVDSDYEKYAIVNGCDTEIGDVFWIFSRDKKLSDDETEKINASLKKHNLEGYTLKRQNHDVNLCKSKYRHRGKKEKDDSHGH